MRAELSLCTALLCCTSEYSSDVGVPNTATCDL